MPADLTLGHDVVDAKPNDPIWGVACPEHMGDLRTGLTFRHAQNVIAKHNREHHGEPLVNLTAAAQFIIGLNDDGQGRAFAGALSAWQVLLGLDNLEDAEAYLEEFAGAEPPVIAAGVPF